MNVRELREALTNISDDALVILSSDPEGNVFAPLQYAGESMYVAETPWRGEIYVMEKYLGAGGYDEEDRAPEEAVKVLVLWP